MGIVGKVGDGGDGGTGTPGAMIVDLHVVPPSEEIPRLATTPANLILAGLEAQGSLQAIAIKKLTFKCDVVVGGQPIPPDAFLGEPRRGKSKEAPVELNLGSTIS